MVDFCFDSAVVMLKFVVETDDRFRLIADMLPCK
jgi:hypothetical protein